MPIKISKTLINELPQHERHDIKEFLLTKSGGKCFLCGEPINEASDNLVANHDACIGLVSGSFHGFVVGDSGCDEYGLQRCSSCQEARSVLEVRAKFGPI